VKIPFTEGYQNPTSWASDLKVYPILIKAEAGFLHHGVVQFSSHRQIAAQAPRLLDEGDRGRLCDGRWQQRTSASVQGVTGEAIWTMRCQNG